MNRDWSLHRIYVSSVTFPSSWRPHPQVDVAAWLVLLAHKQREMEMVRVTLSSLLTTSRWELLNAGRGIASHEVVFELLKRLAAQSLSSGSRSQRSSDSSSMSVVLDTEGAATAEGEPVGPTGQQDAAGSPTAAAAAGTSQGALVGVALGGGAPAEPATALASTTAAAGGDGTGATDAGEQQQQPSSLGQEVLQPQLLGQLLHISQGYPWRLLTVVQLVDWWGLDPGLQVQQQLLQTPPATNLAQQERGAQLEQQGALTAPAQGMRLQQQQPETTSDTAMSAPNPLAALRSSSSASESSDEAAHDDSSVTSSSSSSGSGSGDAACDVVSPCVAQPHGGGGAASNAAAPGLLPANSLEVGSLHSDDCQHTSTWLDDLIHKGPAATNAASTAAAGGQQQTAQQGLHQQQHVQLHTPQHIPSQEMPALAKEWGGSWQQLTGQVAQLHMNSSPCQAPQAAGSTRRAGPRQSFDYEQHIARQLRQGSGRCARRESSPGRRPTAVAAQRQLRASLSHQPLVPQASRCPVHPYMQQQTSGQQ